MIYKVELSAIRPAIELDAEHLQPAKSAVMGQLETRSTVAMAGYLRALADEIDPERSCNHG